MRLGNFHIARAAANINHARISEIPEPARATYAAVMASADMTGRTCTTRTPAANVAHGSAVANSINSRATIAPASNPIAPIMLT